MLLILTLILIGSSLALVLLLYAKHWELSTGRILLASVRPQLSAASELVLDALERQLPRAGGRIAQLSARWLRRRAGDAVARTLIALERLLQSMLDGLRRGVPPAKGAPGASSAFLREVAEQKRKLTRIARVRRFGDGVANPEPK